MTRHILALLVVACGATAFADEETELKSGLRAEGELTEKDEAAFGGILKAYVKEYTVKLKAGQSVSFTGTVLGTNRLVGIALLDPAGRPIDATRDVTKAIKATQLTVEELNATGEYKVFIASEKIGAYTLTAKFSTPEEVEVKQIETRLQVLKKESADLESRLKALKGKK
jgi:hypothetical protein